MPSDTACSGVASSEAATYLPGSASAFVHSRHTFGNTAGGYSAGCAGTTVLRAKAPTCPKHTASFISALPLVWPDASDRY